MISRDCNSKYFHTKALQRFRRNRIVDLRNSNGVLVSGEGNLWVWFKTITKICSSPQSRWKLMGLFSTLNLL